MARSRLRRVSGARKALLRSLVTALFQYGRITTTETIRHERRVELGLEFDRFYDLVRWGIAKEVLHAAGKTNYQDKNALLPLPQTEIDKSKGVLVQNPDYQ